MATICHVWFELYPFATEDIIGTTGKNFSGVWGLAGSGVLILISWFWWLYSSYLGERLYLLEIHNKVFRGLHLTLKWFRKKSYLYCTCNLSFSSSFFKVLILFDYLTGKLDNPPVQEGRCGLNPPPGHCQLQLHPGPFWYTSSSWAHLVWKAEGEVVDVLLGVQEDNEGPDIHFLFVDPDMVMVDQRSGVVDGVGQAKLEDLSKKILDL